MVVDADDSSTNNPWLGFVRFEGRKKDVIKRGGYSVYAVEIDPARHRVVHTRLPQNRSPSGVGTAT